MKQSITFLTIALVGLLVASCSSLKPGEITKEQADSIIGVRRTEVASAHADVSKTQADASKAAADVQQRMADNSKCRDALYAMLGSDRNGYNAYREQLTHDEQELAQLQGMSPAQLQDNNARVAALEEQIRSLRGNKLVLIPDHMRRVQTLSTSFMKLKHGMVPPAVTYKVGTWRKDRDCLWNIAKKPEIYNDPFAWPKIWHANESIIRYPDLIYPGQELVISKTPVTEADRDLTGYRHRRMH
jgi:hypothetical protein